MKRARWIVGGALAAGMALAVDVPLLARLAGNLRPANLDLCRGFLEGVEDDLRLDHTLVASYAYLANTTDMRTLGDGFDRAARRNGLALTPGWRADPRSRLDARRQFYLEGAPVYRLALLGQMEPIGIRTVVCFAVLEPRS